ncbi:MAG: MFS transporter [Sphaerochaetaceae bacterium]|jgi:fucose permease|nr:MFS transporter [Sphaerochaetaceae bacterium]MDD4219831.1 MFS transporter [Sphaerochaetaceae bacterium]MDY0371700.1 MFS transporter [Sphaerochaetaceae bacterium]
MYKPTIRACYVGNFVGALINNLPPLLFVILIHDFDLSFEQMGRLALINFSIQIMVVLGTSRLVDRYGVRPFITLGHLLAFLGLVFFAFAPRLFPGHPYMGLMLATVVFSSGVGLLELLLSAIVQSVPSDAKAAAMSLLHSFYAWGLIAVVLGTSLMLAIFKSSNWPIIVLIWSIVPLWNFFNFMKVPLAPPIPDTHRTATKTLTTSPFFLLVVLGIALGGAAEIIMSQWTSAYAETTLGLSKSMGDLLGLCLFAALLGTGRMLYGKYGKKIDPWQVMFWGSLFATLCYLVAALAPNPIISLIACASCGLGVALLWPGSITSAANHFPLAGASMFAILAAGGTSGGAIGPWLIGLIADAVPANFILSPLRVGMLVGTLFPLAMVICLLALRALDKRNQEAKGVGIMGSGSESI